MTVDEKINELIDIVQVLTYYARLNKADCDYVIDRLKMLKEVEVAHD